jgi:hypothetical protein
LTKSLTILEAESFQAGGTAGAYRLGAVGEIEK